jgi:hypothetical protein
MAAAQKFTSLRAEIRHVVDELAPRRLVASEIRALIAWRTTQENFHVTINQMCEDKQLTKRRVRRKGRGVKFSYGPGPAPVDLEKEYRIDRAPRVMGFMAEKRLREAKARGRRA